MNMLFPVIALTALLAASAAHAAEMNANPLGLTPSKSDAKPALNRVELRLGSGTAGNIFGESSGPALSAVYERQVSDNLSLGVEMVRSTSKYSVLDLNGEYGYKYTNNTVLSRASYHAHDLIDDERVDLYAGGRMGYNSFSISAFGPQAQQPLAKTSYMVAGGFTGGRFWFNPKFGANAEVGYSYAIYNSGVASGLSYGSVSAGVSMRF